MTDLAKEVLNYLELTATGKQSALTIHTLKAKYGVTRRAIELATEEIRESGEMLCSGSGGMYIAKDFNEFMECYHSLRKRALKQMWHLKIMLKTANERRGANCEQLWLDLTI